MVSIPRKQVKYKWCLTHYGFMVREYHRNYFWHKDHDLTKEVVEYHIQVHWFGTRPSPVVYIWTLKWCPFVERYFHVDDGLISPMTEREASDLLKCTRASLAGMLGRLYLLAGLGNALVFPDKLKDVVVMSGFLCLGSCPSDPAADERNEMDGWNNKIYNYCDGDHLQFW